MSQKNSQLTSVIIIILILIIFIGGATYLIQLKRSKAIELEKKAREAYQDLINNNMNANSNLNVPLGADNPVVAIKLQQSVCGDVENNWAVFDILNQGQKVGEVKVNNCLASTGDVLAQTKDRVYFTILPVGVGGYIVYGRYTNLYELNIPDNKIKTILEINYLTDFDFTTDRQKFVYFKLEGTGEKEPKPVLIIENLTNGVKAAYELPDYDQFGDFQFSPLDDQVAFAGASGPADTKSAVYKLNISSINNQPELITEQVDKIYHVKGWKSYGEVEYE